MCPSNLLGVTNSNVFVPYSAGSTMPAGTIISYSGSIAAFTSTASADSTTLIHKDGWAVCNGASIARATYADLYARVAATWNASTNPLTGSAQSAPADTGVNFRIPNLQGAFLRGVGDFADNTKDTTLAGFQADQFQGHGHRIAVNTQVNTGGTTSIQGSNDDVDAFVADGNAARVATIDTGSGIPRTGTETRPQNVGVYYLVKLYDNLASVDIYIPPASAGVAGLVNNVAGNTAGTPILGRTDGGTAASGYVGETLSVYAGDTATNTSTATSIATLTLTTGVWAVSACSYNRPANTQTGAEHLMYIKGAYTLAYGKTYMAITNEAGGSSSATFPTRLVNVASGDADKTIVVKQISATAASLGTAYIEALRIA